MNKTRQRLTIVGLSTLLLAGSVLSVFFPNQGNIEAAVQKKQLNYTSESGVKPLPQRTAWSFGKKKTATTVAINENAGTNNKIQKIVFYRGTEEIKTINVNAQRYTGTETFTGKAIPVISKENGSAGSWFAWSRGITSTEWTAGANDNWQELGNMPGAETERIRTVNNGTPYEFNYKTYPYKKVELTVKYPRTSNYYASFGEEKLQITTPFIDDSKETIKAENPETNNPNVVVNKQVDVRTGDLGITGRNDDSTKIVSFTLGVEPNGNPDAAVRNLDYATIKFTQEHGPDGAKYNLRQDNGPMVPYTTKQAQAMTFYYAAYEFAMKSFTYQYPDHYWVYTEKGDTQGPIGFCNVREGRTIEGEDMQPTPSAMIKADQRDREIFDVLQGIPTSESLYGNVLTKNYLNQYKFLEHKVTCIYEVPVTLQYTLKWDPGKDNPATPPIPAKLPDPQEEPDEVPYPVRTERLFSYWTVEKLGIYQIDSAELKNYAFEGESITIYPEGYTPPTLVLQKDGSYTEPETPAPFVAPHPPIVVNGGTSRPSPTNDIDIAQGYLEKVVGQITGKNDKVIFNGQTIMSDQEAEVQTPVPSKIPNGTMISRDVLYSPNHMIPRTKTNRMAAPSMGTVTYAGLSDNYDVEDGDTYPIPGINPVTVHTPVVNYSSTSDDAAHNQKTTPNYSRQAFILDRPFTITMPTSGQHQNYPGYGNRDYAKYFRSKEVYFPFDTYSSDRSIFYPKGTWINIPVGQIVTEFFLPVWVDEGDYTVTFRNTAENAPGIQPTQQDANFDLINHVASDTVDVEVIGRLYDFHITDIADYNWEMVFRTQEGSAVHTGNTYWTGLQGIDGAARGNNPPFTLPILPGSNPLEGMKNITVKTGYHIKFDLKTKGNMFGKTDGIRITPSFTFVSKDGKTQTPVDLYYNDDHRTFIKVGSPEDTEERYIILNDRLRNVPEEELTDTARYKYDNYYTFSEMNGVSRDMFIADYIRRFTKEKTPIGGFDLLLLPEQTRTLIGPKANLPGSVDFARANAAMQKWYGHYTLPGDPYVVVKGTNLAEYGRTHGGLTKRDPIFLRDGYIILNFNIESIRNGNLNAPHLQYINAPLMNQWTLEGFKHSVQDSWKNTFSVQDGDIVFYNADKSYKDDFQAEVNH
ncbi:DUF5704 domain-containing protein [Saccharibacillus sacchari]|uniref:DUF5704 domain-containing protein n=1 Tax=Saccharibacillus sacchari TaxID=456493 RepID=UPI0009FD4574|nr:DUF5704 domain-containing protein [Saccharibacillus sacchari]